MENEIRDRVRNILALYVFPECVNECADHVFAALAAPADGWISVEDRLPEPSAKVQYLCYGEYPYNDEGGKVHWKYYAAKYHGGVLGWSIIGIGGLNVTHWMPLPPPPTKGGRDDTDNS